MILSVWTVPSGFDLGTFEERRLVNINLPAITSHENLEFFLISGSLPSGLRLENTKIVGTPFEVSRKTTFKFVVRATDGTRISDRTFTMSIIGEDAPKWLTPEGSLPIGSNQAYYIIDSSFIDFQLRAIDRDTAAGQALSYFIASGDGELPPGLILQPSGRIVGFVQPLLAPAISSDEGFYDTGLYDSTAYDFGYRPRNGYDSFVYDTVTYDFNIGTNRPKKLNRNYEFVVTITDGDTVTKRQFRIFVVGDDFFSSDNVIMQAGQGTYTADVTYVRAPIFTTPAYLGSRRANNYQTFKIDIFEGFNQELGPVVYSLSTVNSMISGITQREIANDNRQGSQFIRLDRVSDEPKIGYKINLLNEVQDSTNTDYVITDVDALGGSTYRIKVEPALSITIPNGIAIFIGTSSRIPPGMSFDTTTGELFGIVPYQPAVTERFQFTVAATRLSFSGETALSKRMFTVDIIGEIDSVIQWNTPRDLGKITAGFPSSLFVDASSLFNYRILYNLESGTLPPGIDLSLDGELVGQVNQLRTEIKYKSLWKPNTNYNKDNIVKRNNIANIKSITRRKNQATIITDQDHNFKNNSLIKIKTTDLTFNEYKGTKIIIDRLKIKSMLGKTGDGPYQIRFNVEANSVAPLAPVFTLFKGIAAGTNSGVYKNIPVKSTSGLGTGARFTIQKNDNGVNGVANYQGVTSAVLIDPGTGYLPGDIITISGSDLGGIDGDHDLTFTTSTGLEFYYRIIGNSNPNYNGRHFAVKFSREIVNGAILDVLTLNFETDPGEFGTGTISSEISKAQYQVNTFVEPLNYFTYASLNTSVSLKSESGRCIGEPGFFKCLENHTSSSVFDTQLWETADIFNNRSITVFDDNDYYYDNLDTVFDRQYIFKVKAKDQIGYSEDTREFSIVIDIPNDRHYSNIYMKPLLKKEQRTAFKEFINDVDVFEPRLLYRYNDKNFGVQKSLKSLVYGGIETAKVEKYISAMGFNNKPKRFNFGEIKKAIAREPGTNTVLYEVVYIELLDPLEQKEKHLPFIITHKNSNNITVDNNNEFNKGPFTKDTQHFKRPIPFNASVDRSDIFAGDPGSSRRFPSSISIWRKRLREIPELLRERNYLPLWMRSIQSGQFIELDYVPAVVLCYCKPGAADEILLNLKNKNFDFSQINYTIDRYIIDSVEGNYQDKYLAFKNERTQIV